MSDVSDLLARSLSAHERAKPQRGQRRDHAAALAHWTEALTLRLEAHALDPEHTDAAWGQTPRHADMLAFYDSVGVSV